MENGLELGQSYTVDCLLEFLSLNYRQNLFLASANGIDMLSLPRDKKYVVYDIQSIFLHRFSPTTPSSYIINTSDFTLYYIKPE
jgi:hypothetical protein